MTERERQAEQLRRFRQELEAFAAQASDPVAGFFGPQSVMWRVSAEAVVYLGGMRAVLLQIAHPKVAQGVADHSRFKEDTRGRLLRTFDAVHAMVFGDREQALKAAARVYAIHGRVRGALGEPGQPYSANDVDLLLWVHATLLDSTMYCHDLFLPPLGEERWAQFYQESKRFARLFGIEERDLPTDVAAFRRWMAQMLASETLTVTPAAREVAGALFTSSLGLRLASPLHYVLAAGMLPARLRAGFGLRWGLPVRAGYRMVVLLARLAARLLPRRARMLPVARRAERRMRGEG
jgi:uncharacterized protein (DUF2236 family)